MNSPRFTDSLPIALIRPLKQTIARVNTVLANSICVYICAPHSPTVSSMHHAHVPISIVFSFSVCQLCIGLYACVSLYDYLPFVILLFCDFAICLASLLALLACLLLFFAPIDKYVSIYGDIIGTRYVVVRCINMWKQSHLLWHSIYIYVRAVYTMCSSVWSFTHSTNATSMNVKWCMWNYFFFPLSFIRFFVSLRKLFSAKRRTNNSYTSDGNVLFYDFSVCYPQI